MSKKKRQLSQPTSTVLGLDIKGYVDPNHGIYKVFLDGKEVPYQEGMGNASTIDGKKYF